MKPTDCLKMMRKSTGRWPKTTKMSSVLAWFAAYTAGPEGRWSAPETATFTPSSRSSARPHHPPMRRVVRPLRSKTAARKAAVAQAAVRTRARGPWKR